MSRIPGRVLRGVHLTAKQAEAVADALNRLHQEVPTQVVEKVEPAPHANLLWDKDSGRVRLIDWEDSGSNDRAFELGELIEHVSRIDGGFDEARLLAHIDLTPEEADRVPGFRRLVALGWFLEGAHANGRR
ncbi:MAG: phosphotransferase, partial [Thermobispora bispora]|nr:phosphotransferase [Thermobispora bispora]